MVDAVEALTTSAILLQQKHEPEEEQQHIVRETFQLVSKRDDNVCNFLEGGSLIGGSDYKLIYRHYATLYFVFCVDSSESELGILDLIQVFVETLDRCFENVCELDLIFHANKVHFLTLYHFFTFVNQGIVSRESAMVIPFS
ncbi:unnamed protein product [Gongylonema pulchrum]|uniref:Clat_adaptor_s domain-containing protein n=1 Tax=Gongylonema pulchrum TaxID=637853 RepID=A0A183D0F3_9BILA|nr:unnamed protein product [Gongylonema pulchrum]